jgi:ribosomal protein L32
VHAAAASAAAAAAPAQAAATPFSLLSVLSRLDASPASALIDAPSASLPSLLPLVDDALEQVVPLECAVPKKKTSVSRQRHRRAGQRLQKRRRIYQNYRLCFVCGATVLQHHLCTSRTPHASAR